MRRTIFPALALSALLLYGCPKHAKDIRDSISTLHGFLVKAQDNHETECKADPSKAACLAINKAGAVQNGASDFVKVYCAGPRPAGTALFSDGGPCIEDSGLQSRADAILTELNASIADLKAIVGK